MKAIGFITITFWIISFISCEDQDKEYNKGKTNTTFWLELILQKKKPIIEKNIVVNLQDMKFPMKIMEQ